MCGICGELRFDGSAPEAATLSRMNEKLARRGPDDEGVYISGPLGFGHRRLSVIDLSSRSHQPMVDEALGLSLVFNGAIYNYRALRDELIEAGYAFFSEGDTEVIIKAFHRWGEACVERLHGMFAFAIWSEQRQQLFLARDRLGIKPLYYCLPGDSSGGEPSAKVGFRFASNIQALLAAGGVDTDINPVGLHHQLTLHAVIPAPHTILQGVSKLAPGHSLLIGADAAQQKIEPRQYWQLSATRPAEPRHEIEWTQLIHDALRKAVERRLSVADVPVGVLLSGGLDSSLLVGLLAEAGVKDLRTFSIGFEDIGSEAGSEFEYSDAVAERFDTRHRKIHIPNAEVLPHLPDAIRNMAEPMVGQDAVAFYLLAEQVAKEVKVVQSGQGADEVFGGYFWYPQMDADTGTDLERFRRHYFDRPHSEFLDSVTPRYRGEDHTSRLVHERLALGGADTFLDRVLRFDVTTLIVDDPVKRVDNMTMAWGLEARVPFLDHELVELAMQVPPELKLKSGGKHLLKSIARGLIPDAVIDRPKGYFPMPALKYVRGDFLRFMSEVLNSEACRQRELFNRDYIDKLLAEPDRYFTKLQGSKLWHMALLELWLQLNVDTVTGGS
ncbi:MAG: N-acetylglutaminylglutamine amidotransferase [Gammaproteobacteria bacterium]|nr:N-acetylglutaminylglutamine amidotransferase [Gammaproteobacteria bacterium]